MERIVRGRSATLTKTFTFTPSGTPTVVLTRVSDGTTVATGSVSGATTTWSYTIPASSNTLLDTYVETWTATTGGAAQTFADYVEVAGGVLFTLAEARAVAPLSNVTNYPDAVVMDMRTLVEQALEDACGVAFVPRYTRETLSGDGTTLLLTKWPKVTAVRSVSVAGVALTAGELLTLAPSGSGSVYYPTSWTAGYSNVVVGYEHGYSTPPERVRRAALFEARYRILQANSPTDDRATMLSNDQGTYSLVTPGGRGNGFWLPETNQICAEYGGYNVGVA